VKPKRNPLIKTKVLPDGHVVLFNEANDWAHVLTPQGALLWELCDGSIELYEIFPTVGEATGRSSDGMLEQQLRQLVDELVSLDLLCVNEHEQDSNLQEVGEIRQ